MTTDEEDLAAQLADIEVPTDVVDLTQLTLPALFGKMRDLRNMLYALNEYPLQAAGGTPRGRALHSELAAIMIEIKGRQTGP